MKNKDFIPHLQTQLTGPLLEIERVLLDKQVLIEKWFREKTRPVNVPIYCSVDLRNAGFKLAPVDTNLFPAGFNNLNPDFLPLAIQAAQSYIEETYSGCERILIIPENHTRNTFYLESLSALENIFKKAGYDVRIGTLLEDITKATEFALPSGETVILHPVKRDNERLVAGDFNPCLVILNNDLTDGAPDILKNIKQPVRPPIGIGWDKRLKSKHFSHYDSVVKEFSELVGIDPWLINPLFRDCGSVNFMSGEGTECLQHNVQELLVAIKEKYKQYRVEQEPFVVIKADSGTYGMGVMTIKDASELSQLNRKQRTRMSTAKSGVPITNVIMQEGVYTFEMWEQAYAEPVIYMLGPYVIGGFYRVHEKRGSTENLNAPGMHFKPLAFADCCIDPENKMHTGEDLNRFYAYGIIARLARLAAAKEILEIE